MSVPSAPTPPRFLRSELDPFQGRRLDADVESADTPLGPVTLHACWWGDRAYVCARFVLDIEPPPWMGHRYTKRGWPSYVSLPLQPDAEDDRPRLWIPDRSSPPQFREANWAHSEWAPFNADIERHIVPLLAPWGAAHHAQFTDVRRAILNEDLRTIEQALEVATEPLERAQQTRARQESAMTMIEDRLGELGVTLPPDSIRDGWQEHRQRIGRRSVAIQVRVYRRLAVLIAAKDPVLQESMRTLLWRWWAYWQSRDRLGDVLGWFWVGDRLSSRGRPASALLRVAAAGPPVQLTVDPGARAWFEANEWRLLFGALDLMRPRIRVAADEYVEIQWKWQELEKVRRAILSEIQAVE